MWNREVTTNVIRTWNRLEGQTAARELRSRLGTWEPICAWFGAPRLHRLGLISVGYASL